MSCICPTCHQETGRLDPVSLLNAVRMTARQRLLYRLLCSSFGAWVMTSRLVDAVYAGDEDGGPLEATGCVRVACYELRRLLKPYGLIIENDWVHGEPSRRLAWLRDDVAAGAPVPAVRAPARAMRTAGGA